MEALNKLPWAAKSPIFKKVSEISDISALSREERLKYNHAIKTYRDNLSVYEAAVETGMEKGKMITAKNLKSMGMSISDIHKATGLATDTIENL